MTDASAGFANTHDAPSSPLWAVRCLTPRGVLNVLVTGESVFQDYGSDSGTKSFAVLGTCAAHTDARPVELFCLAQAADGIHPGQPGHERVAPAYAAIVRNILAGAPPAGWTRHATRRPAPLPPCVPCRCLACNATALPQSRRAHPRNGPGPAMNRQPTRSGLRLQTSANRPGREPCLTPRIFSTGHGRSRPGKPALRCHFPPHGQESRLSDTLTNQAVQAATGFSPTVGLNVSSDAAASTTLQQLHALGLSGVRATVTTAAQAATLTALAQNGVRLDLVLAPGQSAAGFAALAQQIARAAPGSLATLEGPDLVANPGYTYANPANGAVLSGYAAASQATADMAQAANNAGIGGTPILGYSSASGVPAGDTTTQVAVGYININPGDVALAEPDSTAFTAAQDAGQSVDRAASQYVVTNVGGATAGALLDAVLDAQYVYGFYSAPGSSPTAPATYLAAATTGANSPAALFNADASLTAVGTAYASLSAILAAGRSGTSAGSTLSVGLAPAETGLQYVERLLVFAGPGSSDNVVIWGDTEAPSSGGHGPSVLSFGTVESSVSVFDPTRGTAAIATYANISELDIANTPDGPLVVQVSGVTGTGSGGAAGFAGANNGVYAVGTASGTTFLTQAGGAAAVSASASGNDVINSRGTDTIAAGGGTDVVYASGPAATVTGGAGTLIFVAGSGNYNAGGGASVAILYGGAGADTLTGAAGTGSVLVAGAGNATLSGGAGSGAVMFGGLGTTSFFGGAGGHDTMIGGAGNNSFTTTAGDIVFGGPANDSFNLTGGEIVVEGGGADTTTFYAGASTVFGGTGASTFEVATGTGVNASVIGFTAADHLTLVGVTAAAAATAVAQAATGAYGTMLSLSDGTRLTLFGVAALDAGQVSTT